MSQDSRTARWLSSGIVALGLVLRLCLGSHSYSGMLSCPALFLMHMRLIYAIHIVQGKVILRCMGTMRPRDIGWRLLWIWKSKTGGYDTLWNAWCLARLTFVMHLYNRYRNTTENDLDYWGIDYPPLSAYQVCVRETHFQQGDTCSITCNYCRRVGWVENLCPCSIIDQLLYWILVVTRMHLVNWAWDCLWLLQTC